MRLNELKQGKNKWCGPAVVSFITGLTTDEAAALYRQQNPGRRAMGMSSVAVRRMLRSCGYDTVPITRFAQDSRPTLAQWLRDTKDMRTAGRVFLLIAGNHWQIITGYRYACGIVGEIVSVRHPKVKRRARVSEVYEVTLTPDAAARTAEVRAGLLAKKTRPNPQAKARRKTRAIAARLGIDVDIERFEWGSISIYFDVPEWLRELREQGKEDFSTVAYDWEDALSCIKHIEWLMQEVCVDG